MASSQLRIIGTALFFVLIFLTGIILTRLGRPYGAILLNVHKLVSLAAVAFLIVIVLQVNKAAGLGTSALLAAIITGVFFAGTIVSGGLLSALKSAPAFVLWTHRIAPFLTAVSTAVSLYLLIGRK